MIIWCSRFMINWRHIAITSVFGFSFVGPIVNNSCNTPLKKFFNIILVRQTKELWRKKLHMCRTVQLLLYLFLVWIFCFLIPYFFYLKSKPCLIFLPKINLLLHFYVQCKFSFLIFVFGYIVWISINDTFWLLITNILWISITNI